MTWGKRLITASKEALRAALCRHAWSSHIHPQQRWVACEKCGIRRFIPEQLTSERIDERGQE